MKVPPRLVMREAASTAADALFIPSTDARPLAAVCEWLGTSTAPSVFSVRGGCVVMVTGGTKHSQAGCIRLRRLAGDLFIPCDADLVPALLPEEAAILTRERGLVVLPGEILSFDAARPLTVREWLAPTSVRRELWEPFPPRPDSPDRLSRIERLSPPTVTIEILLSGSPEDSDSMSGAGEESSGVPEDARPPSGPPLQRFAAGMKMGFGQFLSWVGRILRRPGLAQAGADMVSKAIQQVPRLSERLFGDQEAALREVLRQLQSGDIERGLRRAPIAVADPDAPRSGRIATTADLGSRDPRYSLRSLIGSSGAAGWLGGGNVWDELAREYRRLAQEAAARGDVRRAAYLYGVLLRDVRAAANVLLAGGLFRDAALLLRDKLNDPFAAADAFEKAGDFDEAVRLFSRLGEYERVGDIHRRLGDEEQAIQFYTRAADKLADKSQFLAAGDLAQSKIGTAFQDYYVRGWWNSSMEDLSCGERLIDSYVAAGQWAEFEAFLQDAAEVLAPPRTREAGRLFNYAIRAGSQRLSEQQRDDLHDRTRLLFAHHLRESGEPGNRMGELARELFGRSGTWAGPTVRDAVFATRGTPRLVPTASRHEPPVSLATGIVTAIGVARASSDVLVATTNAIICWKAKDGRIAILGYSQGRPTTGLAVDPAGEIAYVMQSDGDDAVLRCFSATRNGSFLPMGQNRYPNVMEGSWYLQPAAEFRDGDYRIILSDFGGRLELTGPFLRAGPPPGFFPDGKFTHLIVRATGDWIWDWSDKYVRGYPAAAGKSKLSRWVPYWTPGVPDGNPVTACRVDWLNPAVGVLEVAGTDRDGVVHWSEFDARILDARRSRTAAAEHPDRFAAACLLKSGIVAAVTSKCELVWLHVVGSTLKPWGSSTPLNVPTRPAGLAYRAAANDIVVVFDDASAVRIPSRC